MKFTYAVTQPYPWPRFTTISIAISVAVAVIMTLVNVVAVGYETVTVFQDNYNYTQHFWWSPFVLKRAPSCQAQSISPADTFITNHSIFHYNLLSASFDYHAVYEKTMVGAGSGLVYSGEPLSFICNPLAYGPSRMALADSGLFLPTFIPTVTVNTWDQTVTGNVQFYCTTNTSSPLVEMSYTSTLHEPLPYFYAPGDGHIESALFLLAMDLMLSVQAGVTPTADPIRTFTAGAQLGFWANEPFPAFTTDGKQLNYTTGPPFIDLTMVQTAFANGSLLINHYSSFASPISPGWGDDFQMDYVSVGLNISTTNYLQALTAAVLADMGVWDMPNAFATQDTVKAVINPNDYVTSSLTDSSLRPFYFLSEGVTTSGASSLLDNFDSYSINSTEQTTAVIDISYLCHESQLKSPLNLVVSVIVADFSMFATFWAFYTFFATKIAERHLARRKSSILPSSLKESGRPGHTRDASSATLTGYDYDMKKFDSPLRSDFDDRSAFRPDFESAYQSVHGGGPEGDYHGSYAGSYIRVNPVEDKEKGQVDMAGQEPTAILAEHGERSSLMSGTQTLQPTEGSLNSMRGWRVDESDR